MFIVKRGVYSYNRNRSHKAVFPKKGSILPALIMELKWNQPADGAIAQIKKRRYPEAVKGYGEEILLVEISYDRDASAGERKHQCKIEQYEEQN